MESFIPLYLGKPPNSRTNNVRKKKNMRRRTSRLVEALLELEEVQEFMKLKQEEEKKKDKVKKPETYRFSFLETVGLCFMLGPWIGIGTLYGIKIFLANVEVLMK